MNALNYKNLALLTDLYQLTMAYGYWKNNMHNKQAVFHLFFRKNPFKGNYAVACGLDNVTHYLKNLKFNSDDVQYLGNLKGINNKSLFDEKFLNFLHQFEFQCDIDAMPEGTIAFPHEPLIRVKGPLWQCQLIETALLTFVNFSTLIATKASRIVKAAQGDLVLEFGLRRAQGADGGLTASRSAYIGGCHATSNVLAGKLFDIPVKGTHAHSWVMCFDNELESFAAYAKAMPQNCTLLVDTYNTLDGVKNAIIIGRKLEAQGLYLQGIRLDSGDLAHLSIEARKLLDEAGMKDTKIVASNDLDEYRIKMLKDKGTKVTIWGVGTKLATAYDQPALGGVYKLGAIEDEEGNWDYKMKLSEQKIKISNPGILQVRRFYANNKPLSDKIYDMETGIAEEGDYGEDLLVPIFREGKFVYNAPDIHAVRAHTISQLEKFTHLGNEESLYEVQLETALAKRKENMIALIRNKK